jgi:hypothetical protein
MLRLPGRHPLFKGPHESDVNVVRNFLQPHSPGESDGFSSGVQNYKTSWASHGVNLQFAPQVRVRRFIQVTRKLLQKLITGKRRSHPDFLMPDAIKTVPKDRLNRSPAWACLRSVSAGMARFPRGVVVKSSTSNSSWVLRMKAFRRRSWNQSLFRHSLDVNSLPDYRLTPHGYAKLLKDAKARHRSAGNEFRSPTLGLFPRPAETLHVTLLITVRGRRLVASRPRNAADPSKSWARSDCIGVSRKIP